MLLLAILSLVGATVLQTVSNRYDYSQKAVGWSEAFNAAEAGTNFGFANCVSSLGNSGTNPWTGWQKFDTATSAWVAVASATDGNSEFFLGNKLIYDLPTGSHLLSTGEGTTDLWYHVEIDSPASYLVSGNRWYRVRATGYAGLSGMARSNNDSPDGASSHNNMLRKLDLKVDHFIARYGDYAHAAGTTVAVTPQAARRVEVIVRPVTPFSKAIMAAASTGSPVVVPVIDSYNSSDTAHYPGGLYSSAPRNVSTGIGVNATVYVNAPISTFGASLYGSLETNGGTVTQGSNITATVTNNVTLTIPPVTAPSWKMTASGPAPGTITAGPVASPSYASYTSAKNISVVPPAGQTTGTANIYVTGDVTGGITVAAGVTLRIWFEGNFSMKSRDINNLNNNARYFQLYGVDPPAGQTRTFDLNSGTPQFSYFTLDAPGYDFTNNGNPDVVGAFIIKTLGGNGNTTWHYDEALAGAGLVTD
ncbi:MAG: hypothetical protein ABI217_02985, partial [Chthoniobacterales bacterium]